MSRVPRISVVVNNYNYAPYVAQAIDSALHQLDVGDELIVVDDGSTDDSRRVLEKFSGHPQLRLQFNSNGGQVAAVCAGVALARGDCIAFLDADDYYLPGYLARLRRRWADEPDTDFVFSRARIFGDESAGHSMGRALERMEFHPGILGPSRHAARLFNEFVSSPTSGVAVRRSVARQVNRMAPHLAAIRDEWRCAGGPGGARTADFSYDGVLARVSSMLDAKKCYLADEGFAYRIHGANRFVRMTRLQRYRENQRRREGMLAAMARAGLEMEPLSVQGLVDELRSRRWPRHRRRRLRLHLEYLRYLGTVPGTGWERGRAGMTLVASAVATLFRGENQVDGVACDGREQ